MMMKRMKPILEEHPGAATDLPPAHDDMQHTNGASDHRTTVSNGRKEYEDEDEDSDEDSKLIPAQLSHATTAKVGSLRETTNNFTRDLFPLHHFWKGPLLFNSGDGYAEVLRVNNAVIPRNPTDNNRYCVDYLYLGIDPTIRSVVRRGLEQEGMYAAIDDKKFKAGDECVWVMISNFNDQDQLFVKDQNGRQVVDASALLEATSGSLVVDAYLLLDARTTENTYNKETDLSIKVSLICAYVKDFDVDTPGPELLPSPNKRIVRKDIVESKADIGGNDPAKKLETLELSSEKKH